MIWTHRLRVLYLKRKLGPVHTVHAAFARIEKQLYQRRVLSPDKLHLPDFIGIGAGKAGTRWLYENLKAHPDVFMAVPKEVHYFDRRYDEVLFVYSRKFGKSGVKSHQITALCPWSASNSCGC